MYDWSRSGQILGLFLQQKIKAGGTHGSPKGPPSKRTPLSQEDDVDNENNGSMFQCY